MLAFSRKISNNYLDYEKGMSFQVTKFKYNFEDLKEECPGVNAIYFFMRVSNVDKYMWPL